ncbi:XkdX family protein [Enterococcus gilvus]
MFNYTDVKMMYDWGCFTIKQVREFVTDSITEAQFEKITGEAY